jgi:Zn finger protein HypA/HybF involved in hydrogenase expression
MKARFKCLNCGTLWEDRPGPTQCPACSFSYVKWVNFATMCKMWELREKIKNKV